MNKDKEVKIGDRVVHPKGAVLTLNAQEATEKINPGKPITRRRASLIRLPISPESRTQGQHCHDRANRLRAARIFGSRRLRRCCCLAEFSERILNSRFPARCGRA